MAGSASLVLTLWLTWHRGLGDLRLLALAMAVLALMSVSPVVFEWKGEAGNVNLEVIFFAMLVMTSPPAAVIVAMMFGNLFTNVFNRRPLQQITFNFSLVGLSTSGALGVTSLVAGELPVDPSWRGIAGRSLAWSSCMPLRRWGSGCVTKRSTTVSPDCPTGSSSRTG